jgi:hypothetical protein
MSATAAAQRIEKTCEIKSTKSVCKLECAAKSYSQSCDEPFNTCRSTCGLYDQQDRPAVAELLHALVQRTTSSDYPFERRLSQASSGLTMILSIVQQEIFKRNVAPGVNVVILFAPKSGEFKLAYVGRLKDGPVPTEADQLVVIFVLDPATYKSLDAKEPSIEALIKEARETVLKRVQ